MARDKSSAEASATENTEQAAATTQTPAPPAPTAVAVSDDRYKKVKVPVLGTDGKPTGEFVVKNRKDYILELWGNKWGRGPIAKHLTDLNTVENGGDGKKIPYQIVFAATKGKPGGPDKVTPGAPVAAPTTEQAA
jgi:hypothetical protein